MPEAMPPSVWAMPTSFNPHRSSSSSSVADDSVRAGRAQGVTIAIDPPVNVDLLLIHIERLHKSA